VDVGAGVGDGNGVVVTGPSWEGVGEGVSEAGTGVKVGVMVGNRLGVSVGAIVLGTVGLDTPSVRGAGVPWPPGVLVAGCK
jgi:hypothetical protein